MHFACHIFKEKVIGGAPALSPLGPIVCFMIHTPGISVCEGDLKEYFEIVGESRPLSGFSPTHADFFTEMHF